MTDLIQPEKSSGMFGHFFAARAAVQEAAQVIAANLQRPDAQKVLRHFQRYAQAHGAAAADRVLEKFMVQVREQLKKDEVVVDPLVMYTLQFALSSAATPHS